MVWTEIGKGGYNRAFRNEHSTEVFKARIVQSKGHRDIGRYTDTPERSVALWNLINGEAVGKAKIATETVIINGHAQTRHGWIAPFVPGTTPTLSEIEQLIIEIYHKTGRIFFDAFGTGNCVRMASGRVIAVDIGMLLQVHNPKTSPMEDRTRKRSYSDASERYVDYIKSETCMSYLRDMHLAYAACGQETLAINTIAALFFIKKHYPGIENVDFLTTTEGRKVAAYIYHHDYQVACGFFYPGYQHKVATAPRPYEEKSLNEMRREIDAYLAARLAEQQAGPNALPTPLSHTPKATIVPEPASFPPSVEKSGDVVFDEPVAPSPEGDSPTAIGQALRDPLPQPCGHAILSKTAKRSLTLMRNRFFRQEDDVLARTQTPPDMTGDKIAADCITHELKEQLKRPFVAYKKSRVFHSCFGRHLRFIPCVFMNHHLTNEKLEKANQLLEHIESLGSQTPVAGFKKNLALLKRPNSPFIKGRNSGFLKALNACERLLDDALSKAKVTSAQPG